MIFSLVRLKIVDFFDLFYLFVPESSFSLKIEFIPKAQKVG